MEFKFPINDFFKQPIVKIGNNLLPPGFTGDRRAFWDAVSKVSEVVNAMGEASAAAQGLTKPITTAERLRNSEHAVYLLIDQNASNGRGAVTGMLKTGKKGLYVFDRNGQHYQVSPPCVLDFYVHESRQRTGLGKRLFEHMLQTESIEPVKMAIDRPSEKFLGFLNKHYTLNNPVKQMNNYVVFDGFFPSNQEKNNAVELNHSGITPSRKQSANGLQTSTYTSPLGRYGAPRPPCSMGQIIHNQTSTIPKNTEPTGVVTSKSAPETNYQNVTTHNNPNVTQSTPEMYRSSEQKYDGLDQTQEQLNYYQQQNFGNAGLLSSDDNFNNQYNRYEPQVFNQEQQYVPQVQHNVPQEQYVPQVQQYVSQEQQYVPQVQQYVPEVQQYVPQEMTSYAQNQIYPIISQPGTQSSSQFVSQPMMQYTTQYPIAQPATQLTNQQNVSHSFVQPGSGQPMSQQNISQQQQNVPHSFVHPSIGQPISQQNVSQQQQNVPQAVSHSFVQPSSGQLMSQQNVSQQQNVSHSYVQPSSVQPISQQQQNVPQSFAQPSVSQPIPQIVSQVGPQQSVSQFVSQHNVPQTVPQQFSQPNNLYQQPVSQPNSQQPVSHQPISQHFSQPIAQHSIPQVVSQPISSQQYSQPISQQPVSQPSMQNVAQPMLQPVSSSQPTMQQYALQQQSVQNQQKMYPYQQNTEQIQQGSVENTQIHPRSNIHTLPSQPKNINNQQKTDVQMMNETVGVKKQQQAENVQEMITQSATVQNEQNNQEGQKPDKNERLSQWVPVNGGKGDARNAENDDATAIRYGYPPQIHQPVSQIASAVSLKSRS